MLLKDELMEGVAKQMELPLEMVQAIIKFQGEDAAKAAHKHNEIEFSGFGKFLISKRRLNDKIKWMERKYEEGKVKEEDLEKFHQQLEALKARV